MASLQHSWLYAKNPTLHHYPCKQKLSPASKQSKVSVSQNESSSSISPNSPEPTTAIPPNSGKASSEPDPGPIDPMKLALERAKAYKKSKADQERGKKLLKQNNTNDEVSVPIKIVTQEANEQTKRISVQNVISGREAQSDSGTVKKENSKKSPNEFVEQNTTKKKELRISSIDFAGLNFSDKKQGRGLPAGLVPISDSFPQGEVPEVEMIVGDATKFGDAITTSESEQVAEDTSKVYKPKVSSWGVFPRPSNISKTFGGGRNIRPGDSLETAGERAAKDERTKQLLAVYKEKVGLKIDPKVKSECEKALKDGNSLMDVGRLKEALPYYEEVMDKMVFQSELHGVAALQWSICLDSLRRSNEARVMYEKLRSHPNADVSKKAKQFMFSFQAMEMMKFTSSGSQATTTGYRNYFEAFVEDKTNYTSEDFKLGDGVLNQTLPYVIFLVSPILLVLVAAVQKGNVH